jgi:hypothetical protein
MLLHVAALTAALLLAPTPETRPTNDSARTVVILPSGWLVLPHAPSGWTSFTERAGEVGADLYYLPVGETFDQDRSMIRVTILAKDFGNDVERDLASDMARFKTSTPDIEFKDFTAERPGGFVYAKIYRMKKGDEYVAYVNPDSAAGFFLIVALDPVPKEHVTDGQVAAFRSVIKSFICLGRIR